MSAADTSTFPGSKASRVERIRARAYERYQRRGGNGECALDDWLQAEAEVDALDELDSSGS